MLDEITANITANKFYPPHFLDKSRFLHRTHLIKDITRRGLGKKLITIEAQAGQGKSCTTQQFLEHNRLLHCWYQIDHEDNDHIVFLTTLYIGITRAVRKFRSPRLEAMIRDGQLSAMDLGYCCNLLLHDLDRCLKNSLCLVFDDIHLLHADSASFRFLIRLIEHSRPNISFIFLSRKKITLASKTTNYGTHCLALENENLALTLAESRQLITKFLGKELPIHIVQAIHSRTEGWVMGLILFCLVLEKRNLATEPVAVIEKTLLNSRNITDYFMQEVFSSFHDFYKPALCKVALLDEIPLELAEALAGNIIPGRKFRLLLQQNSFARTLDSSNSIFSFHHLFQTFLRGKGKEILTQEDILSAYQIAGEFCLKKNRVLSAVKYFLLALNDTEAERLLQDRGIELIGLNRTISLRDVLVPIGEVRIQASGWFCFYFALSIYDVQPEKSARYFNFALEHFAGKGELTGELLTLSHLLYYHCSVSGLFNTAQNLIVRADEIFPIVGERIQPVIKSLICVNLSASHVFMTYYTARINRYNDEALSISDHLNLKNIKARIATAQGFALLFQGKPFLNASALLDEAYRLALSDQVGVHNKIILVGMQANFLIRHGYFINFLQHRNHILNLVGKQAVGRTIIGLWLIIWKLISSITKGSYSEALQSLEEEIAVGVPAISSHMNSNLLQWKAFALSLLDRTGDALALAEESKRLRDSSGGPLHIMINRIVVGLVYGRAGKDEESIALLTEAIQLGEGYGQYHLAAAGFCQRGWVRLQSGNTMDAHADIEKGLRLMRQNGFIHLEAWTPEMMLPLLCEAVRAGIERDYAQMLGRERLKTNICQDGTILPFLQIRILGQMSLNLARHDLATEQLTPALRSLLALLIASPGHRISQEKVQVIFWPDISPDKARARFDTLMTRMRKLLTPFLHPYPMKSYFGMKQGILYLNNCWIDAEEFTANCKSGMKMAREGNWWLAGNHFHCALELWQGCLDPAVFVEDRTQEYCTELLQRLIELSLRWSEHLRELGHSGEAERILRNGWKYDPLNHDLVKRIYSLKQLMKETVAARQLLKQYEQLLSREEYSEQEIQALLADVADSSS